MYNKNMFKIKKGGFKKKQKSLVANFSSSSDQRRSGLRHNDQHRNDRNLNSHNGSKLERDEHIERFWQLELQRENK